MIRSWSQISCNGCDMIVVCWMKFQPSFTWFYSSTRLSMKGWNQHKSNHQSTLVPVATCHNWTLPFSVFVRFSNRQKVNRDPHCTRYKKQMLNIWLMVNPSAKSENFVFHPQSKGFNIFDQPDLLETVHFELLWLCSSMGSCISKRPQVFANGMKWVSHGLSIGVGYSKRNNRMLMPEFLQYQVERCLYLL